MNLTLDYASKTSPDNSLTSRPNDLAKSKLRSYCSKNTTEPRQMLHPSTVDGSSLIILRHRKQLIGSGFSVVACGQLEHDGESLYLVTNADTRIVTDEELAGFQFVRPDSKIAECRGFDFFLLAE